MIVIKFGGSSLADKNKIHRVIDIVKREQARSPIVVVSACGKTTNNLILAAEEALTGVINTEEIEDFHKRLVEDLGLDYSIIEPLFKELSELLRGVGLIRELTGRTRDLVMSFGERLSTRIVAAALTRSGLRACAKNSYEAGLVTNSEHGSASPLPETYDNLKQGLACNGLIPVVTGFLGKDKKGNITTLGRSGSDYSASIVAAAVSAKEVQIWTDVNGVMTCDPSVDDCAANLPLLSFEEASELAYFGAEVLHPNTLVPAIHNGIPVRVLNTANPKDAGTKITSGATLTKSLAKSVVYKEDVCLINLNSPRLISAVELLGKAIEVMRQHQVGIHMANTSEATVSLITTSGHDEERLRAALDALKKLGRVQAEREKTIICVVGEELKGQAGVLGRIFGAISAHGIKAKMVSQSASELNVAFLVDNSQLEPAVKALHKLLLE